VTTEPSSAAVSEAIPLPTAIDDISAEWLTSVLPSEVTHVEVTRIIHGTASKVLINVTYASGGEHPPTSLCIKAGFRPEMMAIMSPGYRAEAKFYRDIAPHLPTGITRCYFAGEDPETGQGLVILEDVTDSGVAFVDPRKEMSVELAAAGLETLAAYHREIERAAGWTEAVNYLRPLTGAFLVPEHWNVHAPQFTDGPVHELLADRERVVSGFHAMWEDEDRQPQTLIHGDANPTNTYIDAAGRPAFIDWQFACRGDAYLDLSMFLMGVLGIQDRRDSEEALLRHYLDARGDTADSFDLAWDAYRRRPLHGSLYALTPNEMQPADVRIPLAERYAQAALDLGTLDLLAV
jgi:hypothetical protein